MQLTATLPLSTPAINLWSMPYYFNNSYVPFGDGEATGFDIYLMPVSVKGSNQLSGERRIFFTFRPLQTLQTGWRILLRSPSDVGYTLACEGVWFGGLSSIPQCYEQLGTTEQVLTLDIASGQELQGGQQHTFAVWLTNPEKSPTANLNKWSLSVLDDASVIQDANHEIAGLELSEAPVSVPEAVTLSATDAPLVYVVSITATFSLNVAAGIMTSIMVTPPTGHILDPAYVTLQGAVGLGGSMYLESRPPSAFRLVAARLVQGASR